MKIIVHLDVILARRKVKLKDLAEAIDLSMTSLSLLKTGKVRGIRFNTLAKICQVLECQPGDILEYVEEEKSFELIKH